MRTEIKRALVFTYIIFLFGCTKNGEIKEAALRHLKQQWQTEITEKINARFPLNNPHLETYKRYIEQNTRWEIDSISQINEKTFIVKVDRESISPIYREHLEKIISSLTEAQFLKFNIGEAIKLIEQKTSGSPRVKNSIKVKVVNSQNQWIVLTK